MTLAERITDIRYNNKLSAKAISGKIGICPTQLSKLENGRSEPHFTTLRLIAEGYNMTMSELLEGVE